jgi:NAD-dependent DNA ligase
MNQQNMRSGDPENLAFNRVQNCYKAFATLRGILEGVVADQLLNQVEIEFLHAWLEEQSEMSGDILDVYDSVSSALKDGLITSEELEDIRQLIDDCLEFGEKFNEINYKINQFLGFLKGVMADGILNHDELDALVRRLEENCDLWNIFPINILYKIIRSALSDGVIDQSEYSEIVDVVVKLAGGAFALDGDVSGSPISILDDEISFQELGKSICFTGKFVSGKRKDIESKAKLLGFVVQDSVARTTDLLVVGSLNSRDWVFSNAGRKIGKAVDFRNSGSKILISSEKQWVNFCENAPKLQWQHRST